MKSYDHLNFSRASVVQFRASLYIMRMNLTSELKVMNIWISRELQHSISSVSIYDRTQSDIRVKSYCRLNWFRASTFNFERLVILRDSIRHPSKKLSSFELAQSFNIQFQTSRYMTGLNQISEKNVIVVWICLEVQHSISSVLIYYGTLSDFQVKSHCGLN